MRMSQYFLPTLKETPSEAQIVSHRLMLRAGLVRQTSAGIYAWLPLGLRVLRNIERIVREEQNAAGAQEVLMPTIQSADLWRESGRYDAYGPEMLRIMDRHDREMLYGPTNEEMITVLFRDGVKSYRDLPRNLYHIQWKFRDEVRPRFGVMRGREFLMKDNYSFDIDKAGAVHSYNRMFVAYLRTFARMGLKAIPMRADTGPIGGDLSHEFIILADTGESAVFCHKGLVDKDILSRKIDYTSDLQSIVNEWTSLYAATDEMHDAKAFEGLAEGDRLAARGIEVGHLIARTGQAAKRLAESFRDRETEKLYWAIVVGVPPRKEGTIDLPLAKRPGARDRELMQVDEENGQKALTHFREIDRIGKRAAMLALWPRTGRTHQLRVHCAEIGCPILGDRKYGGDEALLATIADARRLHLHARRLSLPHPSGRGELRAEAELPSHFRRTVEALGFSTDGV